MPYSSLFHDWNFLFEYVIFNYFQRMEVCVEISLTRRLAERVVPVLVASCRKPNAINLPFEDVLFAIHLYYSDGWETLSSSPIWQGLCMSMWIYWNIIHLYIHLLFGRGMFYNPPFLGPPWPHPERIVRARMTPAGTSNLPARSGNAVDPRTNQPQKLTRNGWDNQPLNLLDVHNNNHINK